MAYLALYRKWRPQTFDEIVGQKHISIPIGRAISEDRLAHAYLFSGPRGTGKTSLAKILAKAVNCEHPHGANPCNECETCREITSGASMDVYEIDAASNRGIEEIRALKESVRSLPSVCKKKVYIIDEVHMLTKEAFNALLKTLEEPPSHVLFILATTEPEKIPLTILSRCQRYEFRRISTEDIKAHLLHIAKAGGFSLSDDAADLIAIRAEGGLRDALSLLDQCSGAAPGDALTASLVYDLLGLTGKDQILALAGHILRRESGEALSLFQEILQSGKEPSAVMSDLLAHFRDVMIAKIDEKSPTLSIYGAKKDELLEEAHSLDEPYLDALFESLHDSLSETKRSATPRMNAEMGILRLCRLRHSRTLEGLLDRLEALEKALEKGNFTAAAPVSAPPISVPRPAPSPEIKPAPVQTVSTPSPKPETPSPLEIPKPVAKPEPPKPKTAAPVSPISEAKEPAQSAKPSSGGSHIISPASYDNLWKKILAYFMEIHRIDIFTCYGKSKLVFAGQGRAVIAAPQPFIVQACNGEAYRKATAEAFKKITGEALSPRTVLIGSPDAAEAEAEAKAGASQVKQSAAGTAPKAENATRGEYRAVDKEALPADPILSAALKIAPDCDIYVKEPLI